MSDQLNKRFAVETESDGFIGISTLTNINLKYRSAFHGIMIRAGIRHRKGCGTDAIMATMRFAFEELNFFERLNREIVEFNHLSIGLYTAKCGWIVEGYRRHSVFRNNKWHGSLIVGIIKGDYLCLIENTAYWEDELSVQ